MKKVEMINSCECIEKILILGFIREYDENESISNFYDKEIINGQLCMKMDIIVDNGEYDENGIYNTDFQITSSFYPIEYCPICGKKIEYIKTKENSLKLV